MGEQLPETVLAVFMEATKASLASLSLGMSELKADNRELRGKLDSQDVKLNEQTVKLTTLETKFEPMNKFIWLLITGGAMAFLTSIASLVMVVRK